MQMNTRLLNGSKAKDIYPVSNLERLAQYRALTESYKAIDRGKRER